VENFQKQHAAGGKFSEVACSRQKIFRSSPPQAENFQKQHTAGEKFSEVACSRRKI